MTLRQYLIRRSAKVAIPEIPASAVDTSLSSGLGPCELSFAAVVSWRSPRYGRPE